jgi:hypothetical protein
VHVEVEDHRRRLRTVVDHFETGADLHSGSPIYQPSSGSWRKTVSRAFAPVAAQRREIRHPRCRTCAACAPSRESLS